MKRMLILLAAICVAAVNFKVFGFNQLGDAARSNYVVIGAFAIQKNATQFVEDVKKLNFSAISAINLNRKLYYVYVLSTGDKKKAFTEANKIRKSTSLSDTWVYSGVLGSESSVVGSDVNPATEIAIAKVEVLDKPNATPVEESKSAPSTTNAMVADSIVNTASKTQESTSPAKVPDAEDGSKNFVFKIVTAHDQKEMEGDIDVMDVDRARKVASFKGNQNVAVRSMNKSGKLSLVCDVFGYREIKKDLNFNRPEDTQGIITNGNQYTIPFELTRLQKGDLAIMYSVYFYKDAAIMRPESRAEVTSLLEMMKENSKYRIKIHGHTNGGAPGKIVSMGETKKFFALNDTKEGFGSAKKLSEERAKIIREFLVVGGIEASRMEIKAWGGKHPVYDKSGTQAQGNVRVEIEILQDK